MLFSVTFFIAMVFVCDCKPVIKEYSDEHADWRNRHPECFQSVGNDNNETTKLRDDCEFIFSNEYVRWSEKMLEDDDFAGSLEVIDVTNEDGSLHEIRQKRSIQQSTCPQYNRNYLDTADSPRQRSLSPWKFVKTVDNNRIPRMLVDSVCLCRGCINTKTGLEDAENFTSHPLTIDVPKRTGSQLTITSVSIGCTCMLPSTTSSHSA